MRLATFKDDETGEVIPKMAEKIKELSGVDITDINGQLKNTYEIYTEIGKVYKDLDKNTQLQLNEILGGKLRGNVVSAILTHASELERAYDLANNSAGSAMKELEKYQEGIEYSVDRLKEQINGLYTSFVNSDFLKGLTDGAENTIGTIHKIVDTFGALPSIIGVATASLITFNSRIRENTNSILQVIPGYGKISTSIKGWSTSISENISQLQTQKANLKMAQEKALATGESTTALGRQMLKLNSDLGILKVGFASTQIAMVALNAVMSVGLSMGISTAISLLGSFIDKIILTRSELNELNKEFITTNSNSDTSKVIDLVNTYEELNNKLSSLKEGTSEYKTVEEQLTSTQESILSIYPSASKAIEDNTEAKRLNLEATKKLIDKDLELAKSDALNILTKNETKTDAGLDDAIEKYQEYYKVLEEINKLAENEETKSVKIESSLSDSGELLVSAKDVEVYKKRVESLNDTLEASYEAYKILGVSNDKYAEKAKKLGETLGYSASKTEELINKLKETDNTANETAEALRDINGDGIIDATDEMLHLAMITDKAKTAVENLADSFSGLQGGIELLQQMKEEYSEYGKLDTSTMSKVLSSGDSQLIALLGDPANFIENINSLLDQKTKAQDEVLKTTIAIAQAEVNGSQAVVDGINAEVSALGNLNNATANSAQYRANQESILASKNIENYMIDEANFNDKENNKMKNFFFVATERMNAEKDVINKNSENYSIDDKNYLALAISKIHNGDSVKTAAIDATKNMVDTNNTNYGRDSQNHTNYINTLINNYRTLAKAQGGVLFNKGTLAFKEESQMLIDELNKRKEEFENAANSMQNAVNTYSGVGGVGGTVSHGSLGSGSGGSGGSSGSKPSKDKEIADIEETTDWYIALNNAIDDNNRLLEENRNAQKHANGTQKIALMKKEIELLEKQAHAKKQLEGAYFAELTQSKSYLRNQGFEIDSMDNLVNASAKILQLKQQANKLSGAEKEAAIKRIELIEKQIDRFTELSNNLIPNLQGEYEELNNSIKDLYKDQLDLVANAEKEIYEVIEHYEGKKKDAKLKAIEEQRKALEELYELEDRNDDLEKKQSNLADIKTQMDLYENAQDSAGKAKYEELKKQYGDLLKELNTTIRDNQKDSILDSLEAQKENVEKEYEEFLKPENINKIISDAMKDGYIKLGDEVLDLNNATTQYLAETTKGTQTLINANNELLNSYLSIMEIAKDLPKLNANVGNIGVNLNTVHSSIPRSNVGKSVNFENITVQITGGTNMNQADITKAVQKAFIDISNNYKF